MIIALVVLCIWLEINSWKDWAREKQRRKRKEVRRETFRYYNNGYETFIHYDDGSIEVYIVYDDGRIEKR